MRRNAIRLLTTVIGLVLVMGALVAGAGSVRAETRVIKDPEGDAFRYGDITWVKAGLDRDRLRIDTHYSTRGAYPDTLRIYVDADKDPRPDFLAYIFTDRGPGRSRLYRVNRTNSFGGSEKQVCRVQNAIIDGRGRKEDRILMPIPAKCVGRPRSVRVSLETYQAVGGRNDWAPRKHKFSKEIKRG